MEARIIIPVTVILAAALVVFGASGLFAGQGRDQLTLLNNETQFLVGGNWTDILVSDAQSPLTTSANWRNLTSTSITAASNALFDVYLAVHTVSDLLSIQCSANCAACTSTADCCQTPQQQWCNPFSSAPCGADTCDLCGLSGAACDTQHACCPGFTCPSGTCQGPPTPAPTEAPTPPTTAPTKTPTQAPSAGPTTGPTPAPTASPTQAPTQAPTAGPTSAPTKSPTKAPTVAPTVAPTTVPTATPTEQPTEAPTETPCPPTITTTLRVLRQRAPSPSFLQVGPVYNPAQLGDLMLRSVFQLQTQPGDVFRFQWNTDCASSLLSPTPVDFALLGVANAGTLPVSSYLVVRKH